MMTNSDHEGQIFLSHPHSNNAQPSPSSHKINTHCVMKKRDLFPMNERDLNFSKIVIFSNKYKKLKNPKMLFDGLDVYL